MTENPIVPFPASPYCRVRARVASIWADGPDDGAHPDWRPAAGEKVTLTPSIGSQLLVYDATAPNPIIVTVERVDCVVDEDGWLAKPDGDPIFIAPTDDPLLSATGWTWTASIKGKSVVFAAPSGGVVDLALFIAAPATDNTKTWIERIPGSIADLQATIDGAGTTAVDAADRAEQARDLTLGYRDTAAGHATTATTQAGLATTARTGAEAARDDAAAYAAGANVQVGGRNLLRDSARRVTTGEYMMVEYDLGDAPPAHGDTVTLSIKGDLHPDKTGWTLYNSGGVVGAGVTVRHSHRGEDGIYRVTFDWRTSNPTDPDQVASNAAMRFYAVPPAQTGESSIEWIKLEKGNRVTDWTQAPEDIGVNPDAAQWAAPYSLALELAARTIVGAGRPDIPATLTTPGTAASVAAATSGAVFRSTDGPQGAWEWRKRGLTWVCVEGDTGWRNVAEAGVLATGWAMTTGGWGACRVRRVNIDVFVQFRATTDQPGLTNILNMPLGFRPSILVLLEVTLRYHPGYDRGVMLLTSEDKGAYWGGSGAALRCTGTPAQGATYAHSERLQTTDPWPTILPGTPD